MSKKNEFFYIDFEKTKNNPIDDKKKCNILSHKHVHFSNFNVFVNTNTYFCQEVE